MEYLKKNILNSTNLNSKLEEEAIQTLGNRLQHATLSADRRSAVLGLKSFSRQFRESVVEYGLRPLLQTLEKDSESVTTVKAVMETLIILFIRGGAEENETLGWISNQSRIQNGKYPSPSLMKDLEMDQFSMWIADEVISCDDYIKAMVNTLHSSQDFHIRLYTLQFLEALVATRPTRSKECLINIPLAVSTIVSLLNDQNDPVRNEAILLLMALVKDNFNIQKLVAFENTFDRLFEIIEEEGGIRGSILVQDCLTLLTNLLMYNASNQKFFLETDCVPKLAKLLAEPIDNSPADVNPGEDSLFSAPIVWTEQRLQNMSIALEICKSFVDEDNQLKVQNQNRLYQAGIFFSIMRLTFSHLTEIPIRKTALEITGDLIASNKELQYEFSRTDVPYIDPSLPIQIQGYDKPIPAPLALLNWCLLSNSVHTFEIRLSSAYCLQCLFVDNSEAKIAFLTDQIKSNQNPHFYEHVDNPEDEDGTTAHDELDSTRVDEENLAPTPYANIFSTLTNYDFEVKLNPYRVWFASIILINLFEECPENKEAAQKVTIGNPDEGEEVMTSIQAISEILTTSLENSDPRIAIGILLLLTVWLFEDFEAVNDFLSDSTIIKTLLAFLSKNSTESSTLVHGMSAILVGTAYEFSTKSSPIPRSELYSIISKALGVDNYSLKVKQFRECEEFKHFTDPLKAGYEKDSTGLPKVYFIEQYLELVKDNFHRIRKSLSRDPLIEPQLKISFEAFEELEGKYASLFRDMNDLREKSDENEKYLKLKVSEAEAELENSKNLLQNSSSYLEDLKELESILTSKIEDLTKSLKFVESEKSRFETSSKNLAEDLERVTKSNTANESQLNQLKHKLENAEAEKLKAEEGINKMSRELFHLTKQQKESNFTIATLEKKIASIEASKTKLASEYDIQFDSLTRANENYKTKVKILETQLKELSDDRDRKAFKIREFQERLSDAESNNSSLLEKLRTAAALVQHLRKANPDMKEDKAMILAAIMQSQQESKTTRELEADILKYQEKIRELEFLMAQAKTAAKEVEENLRNEISVLSAERSKHKENERALRDEIEKLQLNLEEEVNRSMKEKLAFQEQVQVLEEEKKNLKEKFLKFELEMKEEKKYLDTDMENVKKDAAEKTAALNSDLEMKTAELIELNTKHKQALELSSSLKRQLDKQVDKFNELSTKYASEKDAFANENKTLLLQIDEHKQQLETSIEKSKSTINNLEAKVKELLQQVENASVMEANNELHKEREAHLQKETQKKEEEISQLKEEVQKLMESKESLLAQREEHLSELNEGNMKTIDELRHKIDELTSEKNYLCQKLEQTSEDQNSNFLAEKQKLIDSIESEKQNLQSILLQLESTSKLLKEYEELIEAKSETIEKQTKTIEELNESKKSTEMLVQDLKLETLKTINEIQSKVDGLEENKTTLEEKLNSLEKRKNELENDLLKANESKLLLEQELRDAHESKLKIESELIAKNTQIEELENSIKSERERRSQEDFLMKVETNEHDGATKEALTKEVTNKITELVAKDQLIREIKRKLEESTVALEDLTEKNESLIAEKKEYTKEQKKLLSELKSSEKNVKNLEQQSSRYTQNRTIDDQDPEGYKERILELEQFLEKNEKDHRFSIEEMNNSKTLELKSLKDEIEVLNNRCEALMSDRDSLAKENEKIQFKSTELQSTMSSLEDKLKAAEIEGSEKKFELEKKEEQLRILEISLESANLQLQEGDHEMKSKIENLEGEIQSLRSALSAKEKDFSNAMFRISSFEDTLDHKNESLSNTHETLTQNTEEIRSLRNMLENKEQEISALREKWDALVNEDDKTKQWAAAAKEELEKYKKLSEEEMKKLNIELSEIKSSYDALQEEYTLVREKYEEEFLFLDEKRENSAKNNEKLSQLHKDYVLLRDEELKKTRETLDDKISLLKEEIRNKEEDVSRLSLEHEKYKTKESAKDEYLEQVQNEISSHLTKIDSLEKVVSDLAERNLKLQEEKNAAEKKTGEDESKLQELQSQISNLQLDVERKNETILATTEEADGLRIDLQSALQSLKACEEKSLTAECTASEQLKKAQEEVRLTEKSSEHLDELKEELAISRKKLEEEESLRLQAESTARTLEHHNSDHTRQIEDLKMELAAKKKLEADFEDLMLLWEDQEKTIEKYKQKLRDINQPISSDEEA